MIRVGIAGGAGYVAGELLRVLINHPEAEIKYIQSESHKGEPIHSVHSDLLYCDLCFSDINFGDIDVLFVCMGHGNSAKFLAENVVPASVKIIDMSNDFRLKADAGEFVYGAPELNREQIRGARCVANPGGFATSINLALLPLAAAGILPQEVTVTGITGSTGAGQKPVSTTHFSWRTDNMSIYKVFTHQHLHEIRQSLTELQGSLDVDVDFIPYRGDFARGIFCTEVVKFDGEEGTPTNPTAEQLANMYRAFYADAAFTHYIDKAIDLKQVVNTNKALIHIDKFGNKAVITCIIDNLLKGAVGQAVQNMNLMFGIDEKAGLGLKANAF